MSRVRVARGGRGSQEGGSHGEQEDVQNVLIKKDAIDAGAKTIAINVNLNQLQWDQQLKDQQEVNILVNENTHIVHFRGKIHVKIPLMIDMN
jgi:hypothetical protein